MRVWVTGSVTALFLVVLLASCREPTELTLELTTDLPCSNGPDSLGDTSIYVGTAAELAGPLSALTPAAVARGCRGTGRIGNIVVLPSGSDDDRISIRVVAGRQSASCTADLRSGCIEARRSLGFVPHTPLLLPIALNKTCENRVCDNASDTCVEGACVPSAVNCSGGCTPPGLDSGLVDATPLVDVTNPKDTGISDVWWSTDTSFPDASLKDSSTDGPADSSLKDGGVSQDAGGPG